MFMLCCICVTPGADTVYKLCLFKMITNTEVDVILFWSKSWKAAAVSGGFSTCAFQSSAAVITHCSPISAPALGRSNAECQIECVRALDISTGKLN